MRTRGIFQFSSRSLVSFANGRRELKIERVRVRSVNAENYYELVSNNERNSEVATGRPYSL
jgi:hypothetical protein